MSDLIDRQAAIEALRRAEALTRAFGYHNVIDTIRELPSAQPERKKGTWIRHPEVKNIYGGVYIECSECGEKYAVQHLEDEKFCRNCGARMVQEGEADERA